MKKIFFAASLLLMSFLVKSEPILVGSYYYNINADETATFTGIKDDVYYTLKVPNEITVEGKTYPVVEIEKRACYRNSVFTSVELGNNITYIGESAFAETQIQSLKLPNNVKEIGNWAFSECFYLTSVQLSIGLESIGDGAFYRCEELKSITLPVNLKTIGENAFINTGLTSIIIPNKVETIGAYAFAGLPIKSVEIPASVASIGVKAFGSPALEAINVSALNEAYSSEEGILFNKDKTKLLFVPSKFLKGVTYTIPSNIIEIGDYVFSSCEMENITIPDNVEKIGEGAFAYCQNLRSIVIPDNVEEIGEYAFYSAGLTSIFIGKGVKRIGQHAFDRSGTRDDSFIDFRLCNVQLFGSEPPICGTRAFYYCYNLYIPKGSKSAYTSMIPWDEFTIIEVDDNKPVKFIPVSYETDIKGDWIFGSVNIGLNISSASGGAWSCGGTGPLYVEVEEGSSIIFYSEVYVPHSEISDIKRAYKNGKPITLQYNGGNDYSYEEQNITTPLHFKFLYYNSSIGVDDATVAEPGSFAYAANRSIMVKSDEYNQPVAVYTVSGQMVYRSVLPEGETRILLPAGAYIVKLKDKSAKVIVQ